MTLERTVILEKARNILKEYWGYEHFRPIQQEIILNLLEGKNSIALLPTGGGKSICFQVPALVLSGITIVISPLISLIKDQVGFLKSKGVPVESIYSGMNIKDIDRILDNCIYGNIKLLYISPERLANELFQARLAQMKVGMIAIDEAHCISQWGYDFRPAYLNIPQINDFHPDLLSIALTATATPMVLNDIQENLGLQEAKVFQGSFLKRNIQLNMSLSSDKRFDLMNGLKSSPGSGIIYVRSRKQTNEISNYLTDLGFKSGAYHAGMSFDQRSEIQNAWMNDSIPTIVATTAFGMGIDKADVRTIIHVSPPSSIEEYYQESGRAGRDGEKSDAFLFFDGNDIHQLELSKIDQFPPLDFIKNVYHLLALEYQVAAGDQNDFWYDFQVEDFSLKYQIKAVTVLRSIKLLEQNGYLFVSDSVFSPDTVEILLTRDEVLSIIERGDDYGRVLDALIRLYMGILNLPVKVSTGSIGVWTQRNANAVEKILHEMDQLKWLNYKKASDQPKLSFGEYRFRPDELVLDLAMFDFLKVRYEERIDAMIELIRSENCRNRIILAYFGEQMEEDCGFCDNCLIKNKEVRIEQRMCQELLQLIPRNGIEITILKNSDLFKFDKTSFLQCLQHLVDEGLVRVDQFNYYNNE